MLNMSNKVAHNTKRLIALPPAYTNRQRAVNKIVLKVDNNERRAQLVERVYDASIESVNFAA